MSETTTDPSGLDRDPIGRRDFLYLGTGAVASVGVLASLWPLIDSMNPTKDVLAFATIEVDLSPISVGQRVTVTWRGQPIFIDRRTQEQIDWAIKDDGADLRDPALDSERAQRSEWLVVIGICTHLGCVPLGQRTGTPKGEWGGWFCPCHGSHYDTAGRIRKGPAPLNLYLPPYKYLDDSRIQIG